MDKSVEGQTDLSKKGERLKDFQDIFGGLNGQFSCAPKIRFRAYRVKGKSFCRPSPHWVDVH